MNCELIISDYACTKVVLIKGDNAINCILIDNFGDRRWKIIHCPRSTERLKPKLALSLLTFSYHFIYARESSQIFRIIPSVKSETKNLPYLLEPEDLANVSKRVSESSGWFDATFALSKKWIENLLFFIEYNQNFLFYNQKVDITDFDKAFSCRSLFENFTQQLDWILWP